MIEEKNAEQKENETSPIWEKMLEMLKKLEPNLKDDESKIFCRYFAEMEKGSTCLELADDELLTISAEKFPNLICLMEETSKDEKLPLIKKHFVIFEKHLFATKYFLAKCGIEERITKILKKRTTNSFPVDIEEIAEKYDDISGSDISNAVLMAAFKAARSDPKFVQKEFIGLYN